MSKEENNMRIVKRRKSVFDYYEDLFKRMEQRFLDIFKMRPFSMPSWDTESCSLEPLVDYKITTDEVIITADLPNVEKQDIEIHTTSDTVEIKAEMKKEVKFERWGTKAYQKEFRCFHKILGLPTKINTDKVKATFKNGMLQINAPIKREKTKINIE